MSTLREYWLAADSDLAVYWQASQTFVAGASYTLDEITLPLANSVGPAFNGTVSVDLYSADESHLPDSFLSSFGSMEGDDIDSLTAVRSFTGSHGITVGTEYAIVLTLAYGTGGYIRWTGKSGYGNGIGWTQYEPSVWSNAGMDWHFANYGDPESSLSKPTNPTPANASGPGVDVSDSTLSWEDGGGAETYDVYIGVSGSLVKVSSNQAGTSYVFNMSEVPENQRIYWRVDATDGVDTVTGDEWNFDARPAKATNPLPANNAPLGTDFSDRLLSWTMTGAELTILYIGPQDDLYRLDYRDEGYALPNNEDMTFAFHRWPIDQKFYWRADTFNVFGITVGDVWNFDPRPAKPTLVGPTNASTGITLHQLWEWS